ncbi:MAG: glycosyltransferase family 9 protein [Ignavibacteriaceae bacterium]
MNNLRILISRPDRIGDVVLSTSLPREIKNQHPDSFVAILARSYTKDIYSYNPYVDEIILIDKPGQTSLDLVKRIRNYSFTHGIMLLPTERVNWILFFSGIKTRIGVGHKFYQFITNTKSVYRRKYNPLRHEADYCADSIRKIGIKVTSLDSEIHLTEDEKGKSRISKDKLCPNGEFLIGVNSTSGMSAPNMKPGEYRKLIEKLSLNNNIKIAVTDLAIPGELKDIPGIIYLNEGNSLRESIINFSALDLLISASTGPMHIASALEVPTLSLFCPLPACSPDLWRPMGNKQEIILPGNDYCGVVCPGDPKKCDFSGDRGINAEIVYNKTLAFMNVLKGNK